MNYNIADINQKEFETIKKAEKLIKDETGKDFVMIAWEKNIK
ncbi:hypothetical protein [Clostridium botulinum]|nr:hypothetical protein [Clostridium botulinum]EES48503.1 hypothetical protein CLO_1773 [Clostridium botulinum E1 str. 'BoNT E Beluga']